MGAYKATPTPYLSEYIGEGERVKRSNRELDFWSRMSEDILTYHSRGDWRGLAEYGRDNGSHFNDVNWALCINSLGKLRAKGGRVFIKKNMFFRPMRRTLEEKVRERGIGWMGTREVSMIVHGLGLIGVKSTVIMGEIEKDARRIVEKSGTQNVSMIAYAMADQGVGGDKYFKEVMGRKFAMRLAEDGQVQHISNILWAANRLGHDMSEVLERIDNDRVAGYIVEHGNTQEIANIVSSVAMGGGKCEKVVKALEGSREATELMLREGETQHISSVVWGIAMMGLEAPYFVGEAARRKEIVAFIMEQGQYKAICAYIWGLAVLRVEAPLVVEAMGRREIAEEIKRGGEELVEVMGWCVERLEGRRQGKGLIGKVRDGDVDVRAIRG